MSCTVGYHEHNGKELIQKCDFIGKDQNSRDIRESSVKFETRIGFEFHRNDVRQRHIKTDGSGGRRNARKLNRPKSRRNQSRKIRNPRKQNGKANNNLLGIELQSYFKRCSAVVVFVDYNAKTSYFFKRERTAGHLLDQDFNHIDLHAIRHRICKYVIGGIYKTDVFKIVGALYC